MNRKDGTAANSLVSWLVGWLARELEVPESGIDVHENLLNYGVDSVNAMMLVGDLEDLLGLRLPPTLLWDHPTVAMLVASLETLRVAGMDASGEDAAVGREPGARRLANDGTGTTPDLESISIAEARRLLDRLDELTDDQVDVLLRRLSADS